MWIERYSLLASHCCPYLLILVIIVVSDQIAVLLVRCLFIVRQSHPSFLFSPEMLCPKQLSCLKVDELGHFLMQDQVFEYLSSFRRPQDEKEEAEIGTD